MSNINYTKLVEQIKAKISILEAAEQFTNIHLKRAGRNYSGLCPFHGESTPSFFINPQKGIFKCFGCGESGDLISLVAKCNDMSNGQAISFIAKELNLNIPQHQKNMRVQKVDSVELEKKLKILREKSKEYFWKLTSLRDWFNEALKQITCEEDLFYIGDLYHYIPYIQYLIDELIEKDFQSVQSFLQAKDYLKQWETTFELYAEEGSEEIAGIDV